MFDELRESAATNVPEEPTPMEEVKPRRNRRNDSRIFGMNGPQRFVVVLTLLVMACALGGFCLIVTGKVVLPFF